MAQFNCQGHLEAYGCALQLDRIVGNFLPPRVKATAVQVTLPHWCTVVSTGKVFQRDGGGHNIPVWLLELLLEGWWRGMFGAVQPSVLGESSGTKIWKTPETNATLYSGTRVSGGPFPSHASWAMGPDLWLTPSTFYKKLPIRRAGPRGKSVTLWGGGRCGGRGGWAGPVMRVFPTFLRGFFYFLVGGETVGAAFLFLCDFICLLFFFFSFVRRSMGVRRQGSPTRIGRPCLRQDMVMSKTKPPLPWPFEPHVAGYK